ncbi:shikimate dehydrogenase [Aestuariivirga sp.]|uniref:shikimate dehydrogenase family protein n=1 Tax=Aestuariivirga sp. TaxID=2650926 RepID=UPI0035934342
MTAYPPAPVPTMYFIGVTTGQSSIMKVFPAWARELGIDAVIRGIDFVPGDEPRRYRDAVTFIKADPNSKGALVTTHKMNLLKASRDLFDWLDPHAETLGEISSISKRGTALRGHAKDPITVGHALEAIVADGYWRGTVAELLVLGAGGSSLALTLYLHNRAKAGLDAPRRIVITDRAAHRLEEMRGIHARLGFAIPADYVLPACTAEADRAVASLPPGSMIVNATGLGKDGPGSPLSDDVRFPERSIAWEFNYRGDLVFLKQAKAQSVARSMTVEDGWVYFIHGWTRVIAEVFDIDIPAHGPGFDRLSQIARDASRS